ncbi:hypothetical protein GDI2573 [Gluconacetobacter diazotrophicus PA1 5]|uniref:Uncharacterized protein n=1 Tax=Gluconacetobacter diazotrophicus (strain ATCC 49037 / DSM 5601 / CCUG 37298 / CIP 103539 / LMG 7603 / PAl5) TaxID=272568 RepID=A9HNX5_GLUDA|nr:hypothetical protein GDI2573 [Gluconacetobacter diazotrophicus PA1 5]
MGGTGEQARVTSRAGSSRARCRHDPSGHPAGGFLRPWQVSWLAGPRNGSGLPGA